MHILGLAVDAEFSCLCESEQQILTLANDIEDAVSLAALDRRNGTYQFDVAVVHVSDVSKVGYPYRLYETGVRIPIVVLYDAQQFSGWRCAEWYRQGVLLCLSDDGYANLLMSAMRSQVAFNRRIDPQQLTVGGLKINTITREVFVDDQSLELTRYEYRALEILARRKNTQVRTEDMFRELCGWGDAAKSNDNVVHVHVSRLRQKLGRYAQVSLTIKSVRGIGYRLSEKPQVLHS